MQKHVWIVGAGAIGMLFGHYLTQAGIGVTFVTRRKEQAEQIREEGCILIDLEDQQRVIKPETIVFGEEVFNQAVGDVPLSAVLVTVKQPQLPQILVWLRAVLADSVPVIFLMNGMGHVERAQDTLRNPAYFALTQCGATRHAVHTVEEKGRGVTKIGMSGTLTLENQCGERHTEEGRAQWKETDIQWLLQALNANGHDLQWSGQIELDMLKKCVINASINPLTALFRVPNGQLVQNPKLNALMRNLYRELETLYAGEQRLQKDVFQQGLLWEEIENVCRITSQNQSSMLQDIRHRRKTEIEAINGYFIRVARQKGVSIPCHQFVFTAIQALELAGPVAGMKLNE